MLQYLVEEYIAEVNKEWLFPGHQTPLIAESTSGNVALVQFLLQHGTDTSIQLGNNTTASYVAVGSHSAKIVALLLGLPNVGLNEQRQKYKTPLMMAA